MGRSEGLYALQRRFPHRGVQAAGADDVRLELETQLPIALNQLAGGSLQQVDGLGHVPAVHQRNSELPRDLGALARLRTQAERLLEVLHRGRPLKRALGGPELAQDRDAGASRRRLRERPGEKWDR